MSYRVHLETFEGPLDLLLYLIRKHEVDIYDIPVSVVTESYVGHLETLQDINVNVAGEFLVMASKLMEIKSKLLLPGREIDGEEEEEDPRMELVRQLIEYRRYKEASLMLRERGTEQSQRYHRGSDEILELAGLQDAPVEVDLWSLLEAFRKVLDETSSRRERRIVYDETPIAEYIARIRGQIVRARRVAFSDLFSVSRGRAELIGLFLALLELVKMREVQLTQEDLYGEIQIEVNEVSEEALEEPPPQQAEAGEDAPRGVEAAEVSEEASEEPPPPQAEAGEGVSREAEPKSERKEPETADPTFEPESPPENGSSSSDKT
ncbi:MAG: segregation/condensation protein A [Planctomycetota bacterium]|nr:segregation/condensation protein A [Planctomycetota bacterium]